MVKKQSPEDYRKTLKTVIPTLAKDLFREMGLKAVTMDMISQRLRISKRTLYEIYPNKEEIIMESVKMDIQTTQEAFRKCTEENVDTMDIMTEVCRVHLLEAKNTNPLVMEELSAYPKVLEFISQYRKASAAKNDEFLRKGQEEGYFLKDINLSITSVLVNSHFDIIMQKGLYKEHSPSELLYTTILLGIRGLCTQKGIERIDELLRKTFSNG